MHANIRLIYFDEPFPCDLITFFTILASSTKNARRILSDKRLRQVDNQIANRDSYRDLTQSPHLEPPYARCTVFWRLEIVAYLRGRSAGTPGRAIPQSPHLGAEAGFLRWW